MNGLLFHSVGPDHYTQMAGLLSWREMRQSLVYLQCTDDDNASLEGHICFKALEEELLTQLAYLENHKIISPPPLFPALEIFFLSACLYKIIWAGCQFGNEIVCARDLFRLKINGSAIKTWELHYLVTIMIMTLAGGVNFTSGVGGGGAFNTYWNASNGNPTSSSISTSIFWQLWKYGFCMRTEPGCCRPAAGGCRWHDVSYMHGRNWVVYQLVLGVAIG